MGRAHQDQLEFVFRVDGCKTSPLPWRKRLFNSRLLAAGPISDKYTRSDLDGAKNKLIINSSARS